MKAKAALLAMMVVLATKANAQPVTIYVGPQPRDGFVDADKGVLDSIADVQKELRKKPGIRIVSDEPSATVSLYILSRGTGPSGGGSSINIPGATFSYPNGQTVQMPGTSFFIPANSNHIEAALRVGEYVRPMQVEDHLYLTWKRCAELIVKDVQAWIAANRARLTTR